MLDALLLLAQMMQDMLVCARRKHCTATVCEAWDDRDEQLPDSDTAITSLHAQHSLLVARAQAAVMMYIPVRAAQNSGKIACAHPMLRRSVVNSLCSRLPQEN